MNKILIIEDDKGISLSLKIYLENSDFEVFLHEDGEGAIKKINKLNPDLIILDINLPNLSGIEICKELRKTSEIPVVMLTARSSEIDRINGLEIGADDYIAKPFSPRELLARINSILRRSVSNFSEKTNSDILKFNNIELNLDKKICNISGESTSLTSNEFDILKALMISDGNLLDRETIMKEVIGYENYVYDRTIDTHVKNLRKKLGTDDVIITVRGKGYRLNK